MRGMSRHTRQLCCAQVAQHRGKSLHQKPACVCDSERSAGCVKGVRANACPGPLTRPVLRVARLGCHLSSGQVIMPRQNAACMHGAPASERC